MNTQFARRFQPQNLPSPQHQHGMALIMALVILLILTILGVTAMTTSSLEEKMSGNIQEQNKAFHVAESGISHVINGVLALMPNMAASTISYSPTGGNSGSASVTTTYVQMTTTGPQDVGSVDSTTLFVDHHFNFRSEGTTITNAKSVHNQGYKQRAPGE